MPAEVKWTTKELPTAIPMSQCKVGEFYSPVSFPHEVWLLVEELDGVRAFHSVTTDLRWVAGEHMKWRLLKAVIHVEVAL